MAEVYTTPVIPLRKFSNTKFKLSCSYGTSTAVNALDFSKCPSEMISHVLFMDPGDIRNALLTASKLPDNVQKVNIHLSIKLWVIARNALHTHIILSPVFNPALPGDLKYLWDVWYSCQWEENVRKRFVDDLQKLLKKGLDTAAINIPHDLSQNVMGVMENWLTIASVKAFDFHPLLQRVDLVKEVFKDELAEKRCLPSKSSQQQLNLPKENAPFSDWVPVISRWIRRIMSFANLQPKDIDKEIERFVEMGFCVDPSIYKPVCLNMTLLTTTDGSDLEWNVHYLTCPFDTYFPVPLDDQLNAQFDFESITAYDYCLNKLQQIATDLRSRKSRVTFHFHFGGSTELGLKDDKNNNRFQIIHCFNTMDRVGLANLIPVAQRLLIDNNPYALLVTEISNMRQKPNHEKSVTIRATSSEAVDRFRYALRLNSTQAQRLAAGKSIFLWVYQVLATFLSPLYEEYPTVRCGIFAEEMTKSLTSSLPLAKYISPSMFPYYKACCAACCVKNVDLKRCKRCKLYLYCSVHCQKKHWLTHKFDCKPELEEEIGQLFASIYDSQLTNSNDDIVCRQRLEFKEVTYTHLILILLVVQSCN